MILIAPFKVPATCVMMLLATNAAVEDCGSVMAACGATGAGVGVAPGCCAVVKANAVRHATIVSSFDFMY